MYVLCNDSLLPEFWSGKYHGRRIAVLQHGEGWLVYLDHALQHNLVFATAGHARTWLIKRIDQQRGRADQARSQHSRVVLYRAGAGTGPSLPTKYLPHFACKVFQGERLRDEVRVRVDGSA